MGIRAAAGHGSAGRGQGGTVTLSGRRLGPLPVIDSNKLLP
jgi:hypothetical protein